MRLRIGSVLKSPSRKKRRKSRKRRPRGIVLKLRMPRKRRL